MKFFASSIKKTAKAFSLVEVVVAVGIFAIAVVSIIGILVPINQSVSDLRDTDDAARVVQTIQGVLQEADFTNVQGFIGGTASLYATRLGDLVALNADARWNIDATSATSPTSNARKFFKIDLLENDDLSPNGTDPSYDLGYLAFTMVLRWPAYTGDGVEVTDEAQQTVLLTPLAITR